MARYNNDLYEKSMSGSVSATFYCSNSIYNKHILVQRQPFYTSASVLKKYIMTVPL